MIKKLYIFDLDDTLIESDTKIKITHKLTGHKLEYYTSEISFIKNKDMYIYDYSDFGNIELLKKAKIIKSTYNKLKSVQKKYDVAIMTARGENDIVKKYLKHINLNIPDNLVYTVGDSTGGTPGNASARKKEAFIELINKGYNRFVFYDDNIDNLKSVKTLEKDYNIRIKTIQINK